MQISNKKVFIFSAADSQFVYGSQFFPSSVKYLVSKMQSMEAEVCLLPLEIMSTIKINKRSCSKMYRPMCQLKGASEVSKAEQLHGSVQILLSVETLAGPACYVNGVIFIPGVTLFCVFTSCTSLTLGL